MAEQKVGNRLEILEGHIQSSLQFKEDFTLDEYRQRGQNLDQQELRNLFFSPSTQQLDDLLQHINGSELFNHFKEIERSPSQIRERTALQVLDLYSSYRLNQDVDRKDPLLNLNLVRALSYYDQQAGTKYGVHGVYYLDIIDLLGTKKHCDFITNAYAFTDIGCVAIDELGIDGNFQNISTLAIYNHQHREFTIHSPSQMEAKFWVSGAANTANKAVVFARLMIEDADYGVHAFVVPIRHESTHNPIKGVTIGDCGRKVGLEGVDTGFILFNRYKLPYDYMLDKLSWIDEEGKFQTQVPDPAMRMNAMFASMFRGGLVVLSDCVAHLHKSLTIAIRYGATRRQFSTGGKAETPVLDYQLHRYRLMPHLARMFAVNSVLQHTTQLYTEQLPILKYNIASKQALESHLLFTALKPLASTYAMECVQECRESCGGLGYSAYALLGKIRDSATSLLSWYGSSKSQESYIAGYLLKQHRRLTKRKEPETQLLEFLNSNALVVNSLNASFHSHQELNDADLLMALEHKVNLLLNKAAREGGFVLSQLVTAFAEVLMAKQLYKRTELAGKQNAKVLGDIARLYACYCIEKSSSVLLESYMTPEQFDIVRAESLKLVDEIGESSVKVIDALEIPDKLLGSVLGQSDGQIYKNLMRKIEEGEGCYENTLKNSVRTYL